MKTKPLLMLMILIAGFVACNDDEDNPPATLGKVTDEISLSLDSLNLSMVETSLALAENGVDSSVIRQKMQALLAEFPFTKEMDYLNPQGTLQIIEPPEYYGHEGADFSTDSNVMHVINDHVPIFTNYFSAIEGFDAVADIHPVYLATASLGAIEGLFTPYDLLNRIIAPQVSTPYEIWAMELSGVVIYDVDIEGMGINVFTDPYYESFTDFKESCQTIIDEEEGVTTYTFYLVGTTTPVVKKAWWKTIHLHDNAWKIIWTQEE